MYEFDYLLSDIVCLCLYVYDFIDVFNKRGACFCEGAI